MRNLVWSMTILRAGIGSLVLVFALAAAAPQSDSGAAAQRLAKIHDALGGKAAIAAVRALRMVGTVENANQFYGQSPAAAQEFLPYALEVKVMLPDHYLEISRGRLLPMLRHDGFAGDQLLNARVTQGITMPPYTGSAAMRSARAQFARLTLLMLARTDTALPLSATAVGPNSISFTAADGFQAELRLDPSTGLPIGLAFTSRIVGTDELRDHLMVVDQRRRVGGLLLPTQITTTSMGRTTRRMTFETVEVNPRLTKQDFPLGGGQ